MKRLSVLAALVAALAAAAPAQAWMPEKSGVATSSQVMPVGAWGGISNGADRYLTLGFTAAPFTVEPVSIIFPVSGKFTSIRAFTGTAITNTGTFTESLRTDGTTTTALGCPISISSPFAQNCNTTTNIAVAAGHYGNILSHPSLTPAVAASFSVSLLFVPDTPGDTMIGAMSSAAFLNSAVQYIYPNGLNAPNSSITAKRAMALADTVTIDDLYVQSNAPGAGTSYDYSLYKNGSTSATALTCQIAGTAAGCNDTNPAHAITLNATTNSTSSDDFAFGASPTGSPAAATASFGARLRTATPNGFLLNTNGAANIDTNGGTGVAFYYPINGGGASILGSAFEASAPPEVVDAMTINTIAIERSAAPGAGNSVVYMLRRAAAGGSAADTTATCTMSNTSTTCVFVIPGGLSIADGDRLDWRALSSNPVNAGIPAFSILATR